ncbi:MAG TPA: RNA methyltransferase, partial [Rhodothermales bacterium]|nr:RNA methyltransferase [Rhodothermales bacterium]
KEIASLTQRKYREHLGQMLIEGTRSVESAVAAGAPLVDVVVSESRVHDTQVRALVEGLAVPVYILPERELARISDVETSQGVCAVARIELFPDDRLETLRSVLALDGVQDPGNVGTLLRTAAWFGVDGVVAGPGTVDFFNPKVVRSAMGGLWDVRLTRSGDLAGLLTRLGRAGFHRYGADLAGACVSDWRPSLPAVLVLGSEAHGLAAATAAALDECVTIPGDPRRHGAESLNVAVAGGILMHRWLGAAP